MLSEPRKRQAQAAAKRRKDRGLKLLIEAHGVRGLARIAGVEPMSVSNWKKVPAERVLKIEKLTGISRHDIRPDLYPRESAA